MSKAMTVAEASNKILDALEDASDQQHLATEWWNEREDGTYLIDEIREAVEHVLRSFLAANVK